MATTFTLIASTTVGSGGASSIDFTSIPATYTDLVLKFSGRFPDNGVWAGIKFNGSTSSFSAKIIQANGSSVSSSSYTDATTIFLTDRNTDTSNTFSNGELYIPNYAGSNNKSFSIDTINENNGSVAYSQLSAYLWANTAAITSITLYPQSSATFVQYSTAYLYGIKNS